MIIDGIEIHSVLIIDKPWIELILSGIKTWEMRSTITKKRGWIGLVEKGSGCISGVAYLSDCLEKKSFDELIDTFHFHQVPYSQQPKYMKWNTPWVLEQVNRISPVQYTHPQGAVVWVNV
ncbi:ASCH domain-containing protein [Vibrio splendidus]|nr:ASCH domain-containing protein [Vibrio splendidus]MCC4880851.1 ASCH domain-containing protein [Vibrio splendidus]